MTNKLAANKNSNASVVRAFRELKRVSAVSVKLRMSISAVHTALRKAGIEYSPEGEVVFCHRALIDTWVHAGMTPMQIKSTVKVRRVMNMEEPRHNSGITVQNEREIVKDFIEGRKNDKNYMTYAELADKLNCSVTRARRAAGAL